MKKKISIIGSGSLGSIVGKAIKSELASDYELLGVLSGNIVNALKLAKDLDCKAYENLQDMIDDRPDYIVEAASPNLIKDIGLEILENSINLIPLSVGAFADKEFYEIMKKAAIENSSRVHIPSGAVGGFDVLRSAMLMGETSVSISTEKSPESLNGAPFLKGRELPGEKEEAVFKGSAKEAIEAFPKNVNVAVATGLATVGVEDTLVKIKSIPGKKSNKHEIELIGENVQVNIIIEARPSKDNPKSSSLAAYSVIRVLKDLASPITF